MYTAIPAFWGIPTQPCCFDQAGKQADCWQVLKDSLTTAFPGAGKSNVVVFGEDDWPTGDGGQPIPGTVAMVQDVVNATGCTALGYVTLRDTTPQLNLRPQKDVRDEVSAWLNRYAALDGIYFDMAVLPGRNIGDVNPYVGDFRQDHPGKQVMVLAGGCADQWVVSSPPGGPDRALLWEDRLVQYRDVYGASDRVDFTNDLEPPDWWKDPSNASRIVHTVHTTGTCVDDWQLAVALAVERNVGNLFLLDAGSGYNHLPPYWWEATALMQRYNDHANGLPSYLVLRAAHLFAQQQGKVHGWPNGEQTWQGNSLTRGTYTLDAPLGADIVKQVIPLPAGIGLYNVSRVWAAAHAWAQGAGFLTAWPTFADVGAGQCELIAFTHNVNWLSVGTVKGTYQQPTFAEPCTLLRNVHRAAQKAGDVTALPTFQSDPGSFTGTQFNGQTGTYQVSLVGNGAPVTLQNVPGATYGQLV